MNRTRWSAVGAALGLAAALLVLTPGTAVAAGRSCPLPTFGPGASYHPHFRAGPHTANVTNPWFPLPVGTTSIYAGTKDGESAIDIVMNSRATRVIDGVRTRVVEDRLFLSGNLEERTSDYYAQDRCGNVWYFGEDTAELDSHGRVVDTSGSFHAGIDGAQPGVFMQARPQLGRRFRQEWYAGEAEDTFKVIDLSTPITVPFGSFKHALRTEETTALEPGVVDNKYYVRGIGEVLEKSVKGGREALVLVEVLS
jgi:hypothetical protein